MIHVQQLCWKPGVTGRRFAEVSGYKLSDLTCGYLVERLGADGLPVGYVGVADSVERALDLIRSGE